MLWFLLLFISVVSADVTNLCRGDGQCGVVFGSTIGGTRLFIRGTGFSTQGNNAVFVGGAPAKVIQYHSSSTLVVADVPEPDQTTWETELDVVVFSDFTRFVSPYGLVPSIYTTPWISSSRLIDPKTLALYGNFSSANVSLTQVTLGDVPCAVTQGNASPDGLRRRTA